MMDFFRSSYAIGFYELFRPHLNMFGRVRSEAPCGVTSDCCAYLRTAAMHTCLHIPMQLNSTHFPFPVLAPSLPTFPLLSHRAVNADKRYPLP